MLPVWGAYIWRGLFSESYGTLKYDFLVAHLVSLPLTEALLALGMHVLSLNFKQI